MEGIEAWRDRPVTDLPLSVRARRWLERRHLHTVGELCDIPPEEFFDRPQAFGISPLDEFRARLAEVGLRFRDASLAGEAPDAEPGAAADGGGIGSF